MLLACVMYSSYFKVARSVSKSSSLQFSLVPLEMQLSGLLLLCLLSSRAYCQQRLSLPSFDVDAQRLANATVQVTLRYIATRINTLVLRRECGDCNATQQQQQLQLVDQLLHQLTPHMAILLHQGQAHEQPWDYTLFVVNEAKAFE